MTKFKQISTKIILSILLILTFFITQNYLLFSQIPTLMTSTSFEQTTLLNVSENNSSNQEDLSSSISNNSFVTTTSGSTSPTASNYTGNTEIKTPSSWTKQGEVNKSMFLGVINVSNSSFQANYSNYHLSASDNLYLSTMGDDTNILMINSDVTTIFGYKSTSITLDANSYYSFSVKFYTGNKSDSNDAYDNPTVSMFLSGDDFDSNSNAIISDVTTNKNWATATIWIATNQTRQASATLNLYLGKPSLKSDQTAKSSAGVVFFDQVKLTKYSKNYFDSKTKTSNYKLLDFNSSINLRYDEILADDGYVQNGSFQDGTNCWTIEENNASVKIINALSGLNSYNLTAPLTNERENDSNVVRVFIEKETSGNGKIISDPILIKKHNLYRISFWAKTNASSLVAEIEAKDKINGTKYSSASISSVSTNSQKTTNDWNEYVFFVKGNSLLDAYVQITLGLSISNSSSNQYAYFDNITSQRVSSDDESSVSDTGVKNATLNLNPSTSLTIKNGNFNTAEAIPQELSYPLVPTDWTMEETSSKTNYNGIIDLESTVFDANKANFGNPTKPNSSIYSSNGKNNVLLLANTTNDYQEITSSSSITASANTNYVLSLNICTQFFSSQQTGGANIYLTNSDGVLITQMLDIQTNGIWKQYKIYFGNSATEQTLTLKLGFGRENQLISGFCYFDDVEWNKQDDDQDFVNDIIKQDVIFNRTIENAESTIFVDDFNQYDTTTKNVISTPYYWKGSVKIQDENEEESTTSSDEGVVAGILNYNNIANVLGSIDYEKESTYVAKDVNRDMLMIYSDSETYYAFTNKLSFSLSYGSYYKISLNVKTIIDSDENSVGASIILDGVDKSFTGINTRGEFKATDKDWFDYTIYINPTETLNLVLNLGLGDSETYAKGFVFFDNLEIVSLSEEEFNLDVEYDTSDPSKTDRVISVVNKTDDSSGGDSPSPSYTESLAWLSIPTIIIAIGIIAAVIGFLIKRHIENRPVKVSVQNSYDRSATLLKDLDHKNYKTSLNHKLKLLREELEQTEKYLEEERIEYQKQVEAFKTAKEIAEQDSSIKLENPIKNYSEYENRVNKLERNISSIKADIKILEHEQERLKQKEQLRHKDDLKGNKVTTRK